MLAMANPSGTYSIPSTGFSEYIDSSNSNLYLIFSNTDEGQIIRVYYTP